MKILSGFFGGSWRKWRICKIYSLHTSPNPNTEQYWDYKLSKFDAFWRNENYHHILDLFPDDGEFSLLDVGCAIGDGCDLIMERFSKAKITGIDISHVGTKKARGKN